MLFNGYIIVFNIFNILGILDYTAATSFTWKADNYNLAITYKKLLPSSILVNDINGTNLPTKFSSAVTLRLNGANELNMKDSMGHFKITITTDIKGNNTSTKPVESGSTGCIKIGISSKDLEKTIANIILINPLVNSSKILLSELFKPIVKKRGDEKFTSGFISYDISFTPLTALVNINGFDISQNNCAKIR